MKQFGHWTLLPTTEYTWLINSHEGLRNELLDTTARADAMYAHEMVAEERRRQERKASFTAGKFHAAGGYAKALKDARARIIDLHRTLDRWRPFVEALETTPGQLTIDSDVSDANAAADLFTVGAQVVQERSQT
jgi:hypothetical protein